MDNNTDKNTNNKNKQDTLIELKEKEKWEVAPQSENLAS